MNGHTANKNLSFGFFVITRKDIRNDGFSRTVLSQQGMDLARPDIKIQFIENQMLPNAWKTLRQAPGFQQDVAFFNGRSGR